MIIIFSSRPLLSPPPPHTYPAYRHCEKWEIYILHPSCSQTCLKLLLGTDLIIEILINILTHEVYMSLLTFGAIIVNIKRVSTYTPFHKKCREIKFPAFEIVRLGNIAIATYDIPAHRNFRNFCE